MYKKLCSRDSGQLPFAGALHPGHLDTLSVSEGKVAVVSGQGKRNEVSNECQWINTSIGWFRLFSSDGRSFCGFESLCSPGSFSQYNSNMHIVMVCTVFQLTNTTLTFA